MILLQNPFELHGKKENLTKFFKLASLYQPDKSNVFISYLSNYEPKFESATNDEGANKQIENNKEEDEKINENEEFDYE